MTFLWQCAWRPAWCPAWRLAASTPSTHSTSQRAKKLCMKTGRKFTIALPCTVQYVQAKSDYPVRWEKRPLATGLWAENISCRSTRLEIIMASADAAIVTESNSLPTTASIKESSCCVKCKRFQPADGKVLACLHLICLGCLNESKDRSGCVLCSQCGRKSSPRVRGSDLSNQLASSQRLLYTSEENVELGGSLARESSTEKQICEVCQQMHDEDEGYVVRAATHECVECVGALFCDKHSEKHPRGKRFTGHSVRKLEERTSRSSPSNPQSMNCVIHHLNNVITYCKTCRLSVCAQCLVVGHNQHTMATLSTVSMEKRAQLNKLLKSLPNMTRQMSDKHNRHAVPGQVTTPLQTLKERVSIEIEGIRQEAQTISEGVARYYDDLITLLKGRRQQNLEEIDKLTWKQLEPHENKQRHLQDLEESYGTTTQLCQILTGDRKDVTDTVVIELAEHVEKKFQELATDLQRDTQPLPQRAKIMVNAESLATTKEKMLSLVRVYESTDVDIESCSVSIPEPVVIGADNTIKLDLFDYTKRPIPTSNTTASVTAAAVSPSGKCVVVDVTRDTDIFLSQIRISLSVKPNEIGPHSLQILSSWQTKTVNFNTRCPLLRCDPQKCSSLITLSNNNHTARHTGEVHGYGTVTAAQGYTCGLHEWNVRFIRPHVDGCVLSAGVTGQPRNGNLNGANAYFDTQGYCGWWSSGSVHTSYRTGAGCDRVTDGDIATFLLDCDEKSLEIRVHRTNKSSRITSVRCDEPLYPAICLWTPGHEAEFCWDREKDTTTRPSSLSTLTSNPTHFEHVNCPTSIPLCLYVSINDTSMFGKCHYLAIW